MDIFEQLKEQVFAEDENLLRIKASNWEGELASKPYFIFCYWASGDDYGYGDMSDVKETYGTMLSADYEESFNTLVFMIENGKVRRCDVQWDFNITAITPQ